MLKTNQDKTVQFAMQVAPGQPVAFRGWGVDRTGQPFILPSIGGISLNVAVGDSAFGWAADHLEPGVSCCNDFAKRNEHPNNALQRYACVGNRATVITGDAKGAKGVVIIGNKIKDSVNAMALKGVTGVRVEGNSVIPRQAP